MTFHGHQRRQARPRGCVGVLALPFFAAVAIFRPGRPDRIIDPGLKRAQRARTLVGLAATGWLLYTYPLREDAAGYLQGQVTGTLKSTGMLIVAGPIALLVFVLAARRPIRSLYRRRLAGPLQAFAALFASAALAWYLLIAGGSADLQHLLGPAGVAGFLAGVIAGFAALAFAATGVVVAAHHVFRTGDVHEVLPPLISPVLVWVMTGLQLFGQPDVRAPQWVTLLFLIGPPLSVTVFSILELRRLRTLYGVTVRGALHRAQGAAAVTAP